MIDAATAGREWGSDFPNVSLSDGETAHLAFAEFWPRSMYAIDRPTWPWRTGLRVTWWVLALITVGLFVYMSFLNTYVSDLGDIGTAARQDLSTVAVFAGLGVFLVILVGALRFLHYWIVGRALINEEREKWTQRAVGAALSAIKRRQAARPPRYPAPAPPKLRYHARCSPRACSGVDETSG